MLTLTLTSGGASAFGGGFSGGGGGISPSSVSTGPLAAPPSCGYGRGRWVAGGGGGVRAGPTVGMLANEKATTGIIRESREPLHEKI